jgi:hypothetical protein
MIATLAIAACSKDTPPLATAEPGVVYTYPLDGQIDVPLGARVVVTFSDPVTASAITACAGTGTDVTGAFCLVGPGGPVAATPEVAGDGKTVQFASVAFEPGTTYAVYVRTALAPTARNLPETGPLFRFTTRSTQVRAAAPAVVAINGAPPTAPEAFRPMFESSTIRLVFSEPLDPRTVLMPGAIELVDTTSGNAVPATLHANGIHVSIDPIADLSPGTPYQVKVGSQVEDLGGQPVTAAEIALTPRRTGADRPIPQVLRTRQMGDPGAAESHAGAERNVISIDEPLIGRQTSQILPSVLATELGDPTALGGPIAFTIRRGQQLEASGLDIKLGGELPVGLSTGDITIELLTDGNGRLYRNPYQPAEQRPENARSPLLVDLTMDLAVYAADPSGNAVLTQTVLGVQASGVVIATQGVLDIETVIAIDLDLLGVARAPTNLVLELITDPTAQPEADAAPPTLLASLPSGTAGEMPVDAGLELIFSEPIDIDRARAGGIRLETTAGQAVGSVIESHGAAVVIRPVAPLPYSASFRVTLTDVADLAGNQLAEAGPVSFSTPPLVTTTAPLTVAAVHPGAPCALIDGGAGTPGRCAGGLGSDDRYQPFSLAADEPIHVTFTQPPAPASITHGTACNAGSVRIEEVDASGACVAAVAGTLVPHDRVVSFLPEVPWQADKRYRLTLVSGSDRSCAAGEICGISAEAASFDPLGGNTSAAAGGPNLVVDFAGAPATDATLVITGTAPFTDVNGSGFVEAGELSRDENRVALRVAGVTGIVTNATFNTPGCLPGSTENEACMYVAGAVPVELLPLARDCALPGGETAAICVPVQLSPQAMYGTSVALTATAVISGIPIILPNLATGMFVMRIREPASGPITGYLIDDSGTPTLVVSLELYLDAPDMILPLLTHDVRSKPLSVILRGPLRFLPDGRIAIAAGNLGDVPITVNIDSPTDPAVTGSIQMLVPRGEMRIQLVSPPLRGVLP